MKKSSLVLASLLIVIVLSVAMSATPLNGHHNSKAAFKAVAGIEIVLQNKCTRDVKYTLKKGAESSNGVVTKGDKVKINVASGTEICVDGDAFMTVSDGDAGQTFLVCR